MPPVSIKRIGIRLTFLLLSSISTIWAAEKAETTLDVCQLLTHPEQYANRVVRVGGYVFTSFEELTISSPVCPGVKVWLTFADELEAAKKHGDVTDKPLKVKLKRDRHLKAFQRQIEANKCPNANIRAVLLGRVDHMENTVTHDGGGTQFVGFGQNSMYSTRLVIASVLESSSVLCDKLPTQQ